MARSSSLKSSSGNIIFELIYDPKKYAFNLESSSGDLKIGSTEGKKKLSHGGGSIKIIGKTMSGDQTFNLIHNAGSKASPLNNQ